MYYPCITHVQTTYAYDPSVLSLPRLNGVVYHDAVTTNTRPGPGGTGPAHCRCILPPTLSSLPSNFKGAVEAMCGMMVRKGHHQWPKGTHVYVYFATRIQKGGLPPGVR